MKKKNIMLLFLTAILAGCNQATVPYGFEDDFSKGYNKNLWYKNDLQQHCADPSIIYCEEDQYYYMYMTSDSLGCSGFNVYRSKQLNYWEELAPAFKPDPYSWSISRLWAPNIIKIDNLYYLYYSGYNHTTRRNGISVAVASHPAGPFHEYEGLDHNGKNITRNDQIFEFGYAAIDAAPFKDDNGDLYLYFAKDQVGGVSESWGLKLIDPVTPDLTTLTCLTTPGKSSLDVVTTDLPWEVQTRGGRWNEAPYMIKLGNKYYLTYSANYFDVVEYAVGYAVGDSPLGTFVKPHAYPTENLLLGADPDDQRDMWDFMAGAGHHCFFYAGDELMIGYHAHTDRLYANSIRAFALDKVVLKNDKLYVNGPTWSIQPLPKSVSGYGNVALNATVTTDSTNDKNLLVDGIVPMHKYRQEHVDLQAKFDAGEHTITIDLGSEKEIVAVAIYNSLDYETRIKNVSSVTLNDGNTATNVPFNPVYLTSEWGDEDNPYLRPGCPYIVECNPLNTNKIVIKLSSDVDFAVSEVMVLGR